MKVDASFSLNFQCERINGEDVEKGHERYDCRLKTELAENFSYLLVNAFISSLIRYYLSSIILKVEVEQLVSYSIR